MKFFGVIGAVKSPLFGNCYMREYEQTRHYNVKEVTEENSMQLFCGMLAPFAIKTSKVH
uniref:Uncharacterized protein n=1 Tax=Ascaris lumbricoides TaxID=6252 RepID=A0A0M3HZF9_ASCLU